MIKTLKRKDISINITTIILATALIGCADDFVADYDVAREVTIEAWESCIGPLSDECIEDTKLYRLEFTSTETCGGSEREFVRGCINLQNKIIYIVDVDFRSERDRAGTYVHEMVHALANCEFGDPDGDHSDPRLWNEPDSVEETGKAAL